MKLFDSIRQFFAGRPASTPLDSTRGAEPAPPNGFDSPEEECAYYLSLEFVIDGNSYWLATPNGGGCRRHFRVFPVEGFQGKPLNPGRLQWEPGNSELLLFGEDGHGARFSAVDDHEPESINLGPCNTLTWNEMCALALIRLPVEEWVGLYHPNMVRLRDGSVPLRIHEGKPLQMADVDYTVSGFLPDEGTLALMGEDHNPPEVNRWLGLSDLDSPAKLREVLLQLKVVAIHLGGHYFEVD